MKNGKNSNTKQMKKIGIFSATTGKRKRVFTQQVDVAKFLGCTQANVCYALNGKVKTCKGYVVRHIENNEKAIEPVQAKRAVRCAKKTAKKSVAKKCMKKCARKIALFSVKTGKKSRVFKTGSAAAKFLGVNPSNVCRALSGEHSSCKNYTLKYI